MRHHSVLWSAAIVAPTLMAALGMKAPSLSAQTCAEPSQVSRDEILQAMRAHGAYSLTSTTTSMRFGAEALLAIVRRRQRELPGSTQLLVPQSDWFASVRPMGFLSAVFAVLGKPDLKQTRVAVSADQWQVMRGRVKVFAGISKTGMATIEPGGRGHEGVPPDRADLKALAERLKRPLELRYGSPSCQTRLRMLGRDGSGRGGRQRGMGTAESVR